jgi:hypothetical protein
VNLLGNAIKFIGPQRETIGPDGTSRLNSVSVHCCVDDTGATPSPTAPASIVLKFSVRDTGIGMDQAGCDSLFKPFQQLEQGSTRRYGGTGRWRSLFTSMIPHHNHIQDLASQYLASWPLLWEVPSACNLRLVKVPPFGLRYRFCRTRPQSLIRSLRCALPPLLLLTSLAAK